MRLRLVLVTLSCLSLLGCSSSALDPAYRIALPAGRTRSACFVVAAEVQRFAIASGYRRIRESSHGERLALFRRDKLDIQVLRREGLCNIRITFDGFSDRPAALAERQRLYSALIARGLKARLDQEPEPLLVMVEDFSHDR